MSKILRLASRWLTHSIGLGLAILVILAISTVRANAQTITPSHAKLTTDLSNGGSYGRHQISPDGNRVVYMADQDTFGVIELYSVPIGGGTSIKLNDTLAEGNDVYSFAISPDSKFVIFDVRQSQLKTFAVYSIPIGGGNVVKLAPDVATDSNIQFSAQFDPISSDSQHIIYKLVKTDTFRTYALFSVPIAGGNPIQLNPTLVEGGEIGQATFTRNSQRVIYSATQDNANIAEIYSVPVTGGASTKLNVPVSSGESVSDFWYHNGNAGTRINYFAYRASSSELYSVPIEGGVSTQLDDVGENFVNATWSTDDGDVTIYATQSGNSSNGDAGYTLYARSLDASTSITLSTQSATEGANTVFAFVMKVSHDSKQVYFVVSTNAGSFVYRAPITGGTNVKVAGPLPNASAYMTDDESKIVYQNFTFGSDVPAQLFAVDVATGQTAMLDEVMVGSYFDWRLSPDQKSAIYYGKKGTDREQIFYVPLSGGTPTVLNVDYGEMDPLLMPLNTNPARFGNQVCVVYGFVYGAGTYRSLHSSCFEGGFPALQNLFLPLVSR